MEVGVRELKILLSHYLFRIREGATIVVTDRAKLVARTRDLQDHRPGLRASR